MFKNEIESIRTAMREKFDEYDQKLSDISKQAKIVVGVSVGISIMDTAIMIAILKKIS